MELQNNRYSSPMPAAYSLPSPAPGDGAESRNNNVQADDIHQSKDIYSAPSMTEMNGYLQPQPRPDFSTNSIHEQVFGGQIQKQKYTLSHHSHNVQMRGNLHKKHIRDLKAKISGLQENLSILRLLTPGPPGGDEIKLQGQIQQLEKQMRDEELNYWKDAAEIKFDSLETALQYEAAKRRSGLFMGMEL